MPKSKRSALPKDETGLELQNEMMEDYRREDESMEIQGINRSKNRRNTKDGWQPIGDITTII